MGLLGMDDRSVSRRLAASLFCAGLTLAPAHAETLEARYAVSLLGLKIGDLYANGSLQPQAYRMDLSARLTGLAAMVSSVRMALESTGTVTKRGTLAPSSYATTAAGSDETRTLRMALDAGTVRQVEIVPEPEWHGERIPVTEANKRNVVDPTSALLMPVPAKDPLVGPAACARTLPVYDGYARFDISLHFTGVRSVSVPGYAGPVSVCSARYHPISGHLVNSRSTAFMAQNDGIEVWLAPIEHTHMVVPLRVSMPTMAGQLEIEATQFQVSEAAAAAH